MPDRIREVFTNPLLPPSTQGYWRLMVVAWIATVAAFAVLLFTYVGTDAMPSDPAERSRFLASLRTSTRISRTVSPVLRVFPIVAIGFPFYLMYKRRRAARAHWRLCGVCGYDLSRAANSQCPECGTHYMMPALETYWRHTMKAAWVLAGTVFILGMPARGMWWMVGCGLSIALGILLLPHWLISAILVLAALALPLVLHARGLRVLRAVRGAPVGCSRHVPDFSDPERSSDHRAWLLSELAERTSGVPVLWAETLQHPANEQNCPALMAEARA